MSSPIQPTLIFIAVTITVTGGLYRITSRSVYESLNLSQTIQLDPAYDDLNNNELYQFTTQSSSQDSLPYFYFLFKSGSANYKINGFQVSIMNLVDPLTTYQWTNLNLTGNINTNLAIYDSNNEIVSTKIDKHLVLFI